MMIMVISIQNGGNVEQRDKDQVGVNLNVVIIKKIFVMVLVCWIFLIIPNVRKNV